MSPAPPPPNHSPAHAAWAPWVGPGSALRQGRQARRWARSQSHRRHTSGRCGSIHTQSQAALSGCHARPQVKGSANHPAALCRASPAIWTSITALTDEEAGHAGVGEDVGVPQLDVGGGKWPVLLGGACARQENTADQQGVKQVEAGAPALRQGARIVGETQARQAYCPTHQCRGCPQRSLPAGATSQGGRWACRRRHADASTAQQGGHAGGQQQVR